MKNREAIKIILIVIFTATIVFASLFSIFNYKFLFAMPHTISSFYAKTFCSCYYVMKQTENYCHQYTKQWIPIQDFIHDKEKKSITVKGLSKKNTAYYLNKNNGCMLEPY